MGFLKRLWLTGALVAASVIWIGAGRSPEPVEPPETRAESVRDTLFGTVVEDPYRWLEDDSAEGVPEWRAAQYEYARAYLDDYPDRDAIAERLDELLQIGWVSVPTMRGGVGFYEKREGTQDQPLLFARMPDGETRVIIDPHELSEEGSIAVDWYYPSDDGTLLAYGLSAGGRERSTLYVMDVSTGEVLADSIPNCRAASVSWLSDNSGFYYTRYPSKGDVPPGDEVYYRRLYFHELGSDPAHDPLVFGEGRPKTNWPGAVLSADDRYLVVFNFLGWTHTQVFVLDRVTGEWRTINDETEATFEGDVAGSTLYLLTDLDAENKRVVAVDLSATGPAEFEEIVPQDDEVPIDDIAVADGYLAVGKLRDVVSEVHIYDLDGTKLSEVPLPIGSTYGLSANESSPEIYFGFSSFFIPPRVHVYDPREEELAVFDKVESDLDVDAHEVKQVMYPSADGTEIPMFIAHKKGIELDGSNPALIYAYGCYGSVTRPGFQRNRFLWMEQGGVYALAGIRGGGEYGEEWHQAGVRERKQTSLDDFIAGAEYLIDEGYTSADRLVSRGGSCGGTMVAAVAMQRPDLFRVVLPSAGPMDMVRFPVFHAAAIQIPEYGDPSDPAGFEYLYAYSPYHNVRTGAEYPAIMLIASDTDTRVHHAHSMKMAAKLQAANASPHPILLRLETGVGHGWGASRSKILEELTDEWTFVFKELDMRVE